MIQNDIDLLEETNFKDPYYFALRLLNLKKNKKKFNKNIKNSHFKFLIQQQNYIIDQTPNKIQNIFWIMRTTSMSLNKQTLYFFVPDIKRSNAEFQIKMYVISHEEVQQLATMALNSLTYIEVFLEFGKTIFRQTVSICVQYTLQYQIYIQKSKLQLQNLLKNNKQENSQYKNAFKKKNHQVIQIQNEKIEIKHKNENNLQNNLLRKSLHFNMKKLMQVKQRNKQLKQKSLSKSINQSSFFSKIGGIFRSRQTQSYENQQLSPNKLQQKPQQNKLKRSQSQKSFVIRPPLIGPHKYNRPQNKFYYNTLKIQRQKQRQRVKIYQNSQNNQVQIQKSRYYSYFNMLKVIVLILLLTLVIYYLSSPNKKGKIKLLKSFNWFKY